MTKFDLFRKSHNLISVKDFRLNIILLQSLDLYFPKILKRWLDPSLSHIWPYAEYLFQSWMQYWHFPISWWGRNQKTKLLFIKAKGQTSFPRSELHLRDYIVKLKSWNLNESWWTFFLFSSYQRSDGASNQSSTYQKQTNRFNVWNMKLPILVRMRRIVRVFIQIGNPHWRTLRGNYYFGMKSNPDNS